MIAARGHGGQAPPAPVAASARLPWEQALLWRMRRHRLAGRRPPGELLDVVERIAGVHAQVLSCAELTLWARLDGLDSGVVRDALWQERSLVKLWAMRGTLHLLPARELGLWLAALSGHERYGEIGRDQFAELVETVGRALTDRLLTREQLAREVERLSGSAELGERVLGSWGLHLKPASLHGRLCFAPGAPDGGQKVRFTAPRTWLGALEPVDPEIAIPAIARRFLRVNAPATIEDFARWWGSGTTTARRMLASLGDELLAVEVDGEQRWMLAADLAEAEVAAPMRAVVLLPGFDQWTVAAPRGVDALLVPSRRAQVYRPQGWISPVLAVDGRVAGVWRHVRGARELCVEIEPFGRLPRWARAGVEAEAARLAAFHERPLRLRWEA